MIDQSSRSAERARNVCCAGMCRAGGCHELFHFRFHQVRQILHEKPELDVVDSRGWNIFIYACETGLLKELGDVLMSFQDSIRTVVGWKDPQGSCALHHAVSKGSFHDVELFCRILPNVTEEDCNGNNALHLVCCEGNVLILKHLLEFIFNDQVVVLDDRREALRKERIAIQRAEEDQLAELGASNASALADLQHKSEREKVLDSQAAMKEGVKQAVLNMKDRSKQGMARKILMDPVVLTPYREWIAAKTRAAEGGSPMESLEHSGGVSPSGVEDTMSQSLSMKSSTARRIGSSVDATTDTKVDQRTVRTVDFRNGMGETPLMLASAKGNLNCFLALLDKRNPIVADPLA